MLAMVVASGRAAVTLPAEARIPVHAGSVEHRYLASKRAGLVIWPAVGAVLLGVVGAVPMSITGTPVGVALLAWSGLSKLLGARTPR